MKKTILALTIMLAAATLVAVFSGPAMAKVTGRCDNCHTMHNSQGGSDLYAEPYDTLLKGDCVGCHTGTNTGGTTDTGATPYVMSDSGAPTWGTNTLAGGNFWWVAQGDDAKGHNVLGVSSQDGNIDTTAAEGAPGGAAGMAGFNCANSCHRTLAVAPTSGGGSPSNMAGGCEGCHLNVMHHANDGTGTKYVDTAAKGWYRFLSGHSGGAGAGVQGIEHVGWGYNASLGGTNHNEYLGYHDVWKTLGLGLGSVIAGSMTSYCCGCHAEFHIQDTTNTGASPWIRHPSDFVIPNEREYASMSTSYNPDTPVARSAAKMATLGDNPSGTVAAGEDMVMCLSCHVAHGSPYDDMLRWDYADMVAGDNTKSGGCFVCHTTKND